MPQQEWSSRSAHWPAALVLIASMACEHSSPAESEPPLPLPPFSSTSPVRLTFNVADDRTPSWLPDGSGLVASCSYGNPVAGVQICVVDPSTGEISYTDHILGGARPEMQPTSTQ